MLKAFAVTDVGMKRKINQDYVYTSQQPVGSLPNLFLVADGMGGHNAGDYASKYAVETIVETASALREQHPAMVFTKAIETANDRIRWKAEEDSTLAGMGTTIVAACVNGNVLEVANVGDSRLYVIGDDIRQITIDHSLVEEMIRMGGLDREAARNHPEKNIITRAVGADRNVNVDCFAVELEKDEMVLMCSDGLTNMLEDSEILSIIKKEDEIQNRALALIKEANEKGGKDNIAVVLIEPSSNIQ